MYTVIINKKFIRRTFVSSILFCWSLMFPIAVIQRTSASTSFFIWKSKTKLIFPLKCIHFYNGAKVTNNCFLCIYIISSFYMENNTQYKAHNTIQEKRIEDILFFFLQIPLKCVLMYQALWQIKTKEEAQKYMHTNLFFFPL